MLPQWRFWWVGGHDGLTLWLRTAVEEAFRETPDFNLTNETGSRTLVVTIPTNVDWKFEKVKVFAVASDPPSAPRLARSSVIRTGSGEQDQRSARPRDRRRCARNCRGRHPRRLPRGDLDPGSSRFTLLLVVASRFPRLHLLRQQAAREDSEMTMAGAALLVHPSTKACFSTLPIAAPTSIRMTNMTAIPSITRIE